MKTPEHIKFTYLYRDASNYKSWGEIIFKNHDKLSLAEIEERLRCSFDSGELFVAAQVSIPEVFLFLQDKLTDDDHFYHEFHSVEGTNDDCNDDCDRSIKVFIEQVEQACRTGWRLGIQIASMTNRNADKTTTLN
jgi:hypothetical protein